MGIEWLDWAFVGVLASIAAIPFGWWLHSRRREAAVLTWIVLLAVGVASLVIIFDASRLDDAQRSGTPTGSGAPSGAQVSKPTPTSTPAARTPVQYSSWSGDEPDG
jgi:hypothetical protein